MVRQAKTTRMRLIELEGGKSIEEILEVLCDKYTLIEEIAADLGIETSTAYKWLVQFGFEKRWVKPEPTTEEAQN